MRFLIGLMLVLFSSGALFAQGTDCPSNAVFQYRNQKDISDLVHNVLSIDGSPRYLPGDFAKKKNLTQKEMDFLYGATGEFLCDGKTAGSANVVGRRDLLLASSHIFFNVHDCSVKRDPAKCVFRTYAEGKEVVRKIGVRESGFKCPRPEGTEDWIILDLEEDVPKSIEPYAIGDASAMKTGDEVLAVNGINTDFFSKNPSTGAFTRSKSFGICMWDDYVGDWIATNCSASHGSSGSAIVNRQRQIVGVAAATSETMDEAVAALKRKPFVANRCEYDRMSCATQYVPIRGKLKAALEAAISSIDL